MSAVPKMDKQEHTKAIKESFLNTFVHDFLMVPSFVKILTYLNVMAALVIIMLLLTGRNVNFWLFLLYIPFFYFLDLMRKSRKEKDRLQIAHRMPFFADAMANSLSLGATMEDAFRQSTHYLEGPIKTELNKLILKSALGKNLGVLLQELDLKFPNTGLIYLISLLDAYSELGVGISPLLKRVSLILDTKERAEEKVRTILAAGSSYARLTMMVFGGIFLGLSLVLKNQFTILLSPSLKPIFIYLTLWAFVGIVVVTRITSMEFTRIFALRPYIKKFMNNKKWTRDELYHFSGKDWFGIKRLLLQYAPMVVGFFCAYITPFNSNPITIGLSFIVGSAGCWFLTQYILKGMVEDQLIKVIETFPEILQVFTIGLNSGLNTYLAFLFAKNSVHNTAPRILLEELCRTEFAMECGEDHSKTWARLAINLPFETIVDFCDIMVVAPMHGESIVNSITQMNSNYQEKKLTLVEKKATAIGQFVIPVIVLAFFPLFMFFIFSPVIYKISSFINL